MHLRHIPLAALIVAAFSATPCFASPDSIITFNEIQYNPVGLSEAGEYVEFFNQQGIKVDISGWRVDGIGYTFPAGTIVNPGAYFVVAKTPAAGQFGPFTGNIGNDGQELRLINQKGRMMDEINFGDDDPWPAGADGSGFTLAKNQPYTDSGRHANWSVSTQPNGTPGVLNFPAAGAPPPTTTVPVFALNNVWRYNQSGADLGAAWATTAHPVGGAWASGPGALAYEISATVPIGTPLILPGLNNPYVMTYYFETEFNVTPAQLALLSALKIRHALDDGAIFYINGQEATRVNMPAGPVTAATTALLSVEAGTSVSPNVSLPTTALVAGSNRLSVEVHQISVGNSDIVFGAELDLDVLQAAPTATPVRINEIPPASAASWWVELTNAGTAQVDLTGVVVNIGGDTAREYVIPSGTLGANGVLQLNEAVLGFRPADGEKVFIYNSGKTTLLDAREQTNRLRGRSTTRGIEWAYPSAATPGAANSFVFNDSIVISEIQYNPPSIAPTPAIPATFQTDPLIAYGDTWRYNAADENLPVDWAASAHAVGGNWKSGPGPIGVETAVLPVALATTITPYAAATVTYYFEREFTVTAAQIANATSVEITHEIDDGAVFYLNGVELPSRFTMPAGPVGPETLATTGIGDATLNSLVFSTSGLVPGVNRLSVEVHQNSAASSDIVFGMKMDARVQLTPGTPAQPLTNSNNQWLELTNRSGAPVVLTGWDFEDGIEFAFPAGTSLAAGERACIVRDAALFSAAYPAARVLGTFSGSMSRSGEHIVLRDALRNTADQVRYFDSGHWPEYPDGGGTSLELKDLDSDNMAGEAWAASDESSRTAWRTYSYRGTAAASNGGPDGQWLEFNMGLMSAGEIWIDDLNVIELPTGAATQRITDPGFNNATAWKMIGNHRASEIISEPGNTSNKILRLVATGPTEHIHNQIYTTLNAAVTNGREYEINFRARWVAGSNQLHSRLYFNRLARVNVIDRVANPGTPGAVNSRAIANDGPTYGNLKHSPPVPPVNAVTTVSCTASDPDGITAMTLFYSVNGGGFLSTSMALVSGVYSGSIPGQAAGAVVQFYIRGTDAAGANTFFPALGPASRALYKVNDNTAATNGLHNFRVITTIADTTWMHQAINVMSNDRIEGTVIDRENDIYYNAGIRLKSSERGRNDIIRVGYNIDFPSDSLFRGSLGGVAIDRSEGTASGQRELLFDMMISYAGGAISRYNDLVKILAPNSSLTRTAVLQLIRYDEGFLEEEFENGGDGKLYEYELVYYPTTADANGYKLPYPSPDNVIGVSITNHGDDPERYRWHFLNKINREADDFTPIMNYNKLFATSGAEFETLLPQRVDVDTWFRGMAYGTLSGAGDNNAGDNAQHNCVLYARPDGRVIFMPHDMDFSFAETRSVTTNTQCAVLTTVPARRRQYYGHLHDIITTTYNNAYMSIWTNHFATLDSAQPWSSYLTFMTNRSNNVLSQITSAIPNVAFAITTPSPLTVASSTATVAGNGWVNVREIRVQGSTAPLAVTWTGNSTWQVTLPAAPGQSTVVLQAINFSGAVIGTASIIITNTSPVAPASSANLVVSEIMYHPGDPTPAEITAGYNDGDMFEFIELQNISNAVVDLTGVRFVGGIEYDFTAGTTMQPGARLTIASNRSAFLTRYPGASATLAAGAFLNATQLSNSGESITLNNALGAVLRSFTYDDTSPWPVAADGTGYSLVLIAPATNPDHNLPASWRCSAMVGGAPGLGDAVPFTGTPGADDDHDGLNAILEYALGSSDAVANSNDLTVAVGPDNYLEVTFTRRLGADDVITEVQSSSDLSTWTPAFTLTEGPLGNGNALVTARSLAPVTGSRVFTRISVRTR